MDRETLARWQRQDRLPTLLGELEAMLGELGFEFYAFSFSLGRHQLHSSNIASACGRHDAVPGLMRAARAYCPGSCFPVPWTAQLFSDDSAAWQCAQACGLSHGWIQPQQGDGGHSCLAVLRSRSPLSSQEMYRKATSVMWLSERLHQAAAALLSNDPQR